MQLFSSLRGWFCANDFMLYWQEDEQKSEETQGGKICTTNLIKMI